MTTVEDWGWVNWCATHRHLPSDRTIIGDNRCWSLCGTAVVQHTVPDATRRLRYGQQPKDYDAIPKCKFCQRKASTT